MLLRSAKTIHSFTYIHLFTHSLINLYTDVEILKRKANAVLRILYLNHVKKEIGWVLTFDLQFMHMQ